MSLTENTEQALKRPISGLFRISDEEFLFVPSAKKSAIEFALPIRSGPNIGCKFISALNGNFVSTPRINSDLTDANSAFSRAQDKAYLLAVNQQKLTPAKVIPRNMDANDRVIAGLGSQRERATQIAGTTVTTGR